MRVRALSSVPGCRVRGRNRHNRSPQFGVKRKRSVKTYQMQARPERDAVGAGCRLQGREQVLRIIDPLRVRQIGRAHFFDQMPLAGQQPRLLR